MDRPVRAPWYLGATTPVTLPWLVRLRWAATAVQVAIVLTAVAFPAADFPLRRVAWLLVAAAVVNGSIAWWLSERRAVPTAAAVGDLALHVLLLTGLLELTGGPINPFSVVYAVPVILAGLTLGAFWGGLIGAFVAACYGLLISWHAQELVPIHHRLTDFPTHLFTMWTAIVLGAELAAHFVVQASNALAKREREIDAMRRQAARTERLMALTTLAAGAAHELSTPLGTIAVASHELERALENNRRSTLAATGQRSTLTAADPSSALAAALRSALINDARLIRAEVTRCQAILDQMSGRAGGIAEDVPEWLDLDTVFADIRHDLPIDQAGRVEIAVSASLGRIQLPRVGFRQAVLTLVKNACEASDGTVVVTVGRSGGRMHLTVRDEGAGIPPEILPRLGEPFFTTKDAGRGLGLGLFLARIFAERIGGALTLESGDGTVASLDLPIQADAVGAR